MIDLLFKCRPYIEPHGDADSRRLLREIDAAGWQPIETAPKDGKPFLAYFGGNPYITRWDDERYANKPRPYFSPSGYSFGRIMARSNQPQFWMPLPASAENTPRDSIDSEYVEEGHDVV